MSLYNQAPRAVESCDHCSGSCASATADRGARLAEHTIAESSMGDLTVRDVLTLHPSAVSVLHTYGIDTCCGADASLRDAALRAGAELNSLLISLEAQFGLRAAQARPT